MRRIPLLLWLGLAAACGETYEATSKESCMRACEMLETCFGGRFELAETEVVDYGIPGFSDCPERCQAGNGDALVTCAEAELVTTCPIEADDLTCGVLRACVQVSYGVVETAVVELDVDLRPAESFAPGTAPSCTNGDCGALDCLAPPDPSAVASTDLCDALGIDSIWLEIRSPGTFQDMTTDPLPCESALQAPTRVLVPPGLVIVAVMAEGTAPWDPLRGGSRESLGSYCLRLAAGTVDAEGDSTEVVLPLRSAEQTLAEAATSTSCGSSPPP